MAIDCDILLYSVIDTFQGLNIKFSESAQKYYDKWQSKFYSYKVSKQLTYMKYALDVATMLSKYLGRIYSIDLNKDANDASYDFMVSWGSKGRKKSRISFHRETIRVNNLIARKLMKACRYKKNSNIYKLYCESYDKLNDKFYKKIKSNENYSDIKSSLKMDMLKSFSELVMQTLSKKKKCAQSLYNALFTETDRIVFKLHVNKFTMYDFGQEQMVIKSFKLRQIDDRTLSLSFNNGAAFQLMLSTNSTKIKPQLSLKFHVKFQNLDQLFRVSE